MEREREEERGEGEVEKAGSACSCDPSSSPPRNCGRRDLKLTLRLLKTVRERENEELDGRNMGVIEFWIVWGHEKYLVFCGYKVDLEVH